MSNPSEVRVQPFPQLYFCCDERRRDSVRGTALNGIDYLEVVDHDALAPADRQRFLRVHFVNDIAANSLAATNVSISGGERVRPIVILNAKIGTGDDADVLTVEVEEPGDYSIYTLSLVRGPNNPAPPSGIDPRLAWIEFSFKVECPSDFDCAPKHICPPEPRPQPEINYLAKDYATFRKLILDRMALLLPDWRERNPADLGITLVELLAYTGDYLSYRQDAVATEAYLRTARKRVSLRRHARLVDYFVHDGTNARVWLQLTTEAPNLVVPKGQQIFSRLDRIPPRIAPLSSVLDDALRQHPLVFETIHNITLFTAHNAMPFYTWGDARCCLPKGATQATLAGHFPNLAPEDVLIFEEVRGSFTGKEEDADRARRCALRLTGVRAFNDTGASLTDPLTNAEVTRIEWMWEDRLPFPFCLSEKRGAQFYDDLSIARGNIVLADHGHTIPTVESLGKVPQPQILLPSDPGADRCHRPSPQHASPRFRPSLQGRPLTQAADYDATLPASQSLFVDPAKSQPAISKLHSKLNGDEADWKLQRDDLLDSAPDAQDFVVEIESDQTAYLRFGDDEYGQKPKPETEFSATYRVGNGTAGNVGAETLTHIVTAAAVSSVRNPLPATGGVDPETMAQIRRDAPRAFRTQERAVTEEDYARKVERDRAIQRAAATFRWTGSWHTVFITVDPFDALPLTSDFEKLENKLRDEIEQYRMAGHDLEIDSPRYVSLEIEMFVCVKRDYFRSDVGAALLDVFSNRTFADGRKGIFQPDFFTFGQTVYLSELYAAAQAVAGVTSVQIAVFRRQGLPETSGLADGFLKMHRLEIARLDNDPNLVEHGVFKLSLGGGR